MKLSASPFVVRVWMPMMLAVGVFLFFHGMAPEYWLLALPLLLIIIFMSTLAEIQDDGHRILVKTLWNSLAVPRQDVVKTAQSVLDGIGVLQLRRFVLPWGRIYFVADWSKLGVASAGTGEESTGDETKRHPFLRATFESLVVAISGFLAARAMSSGVHVFRIETSTQRMVAFTLAGALCVVFAIARARRPSFANVVLFVATSIAGLVHW
jgi:hypothetical protein